VPPVSADLRITATISTTGVSGIDIRGTIAECYGITFSAGDAANTANVTFGTSGRTERFVNCAFRLGGSAAAARITPSLGGVGSVTIWENCTIQFTNVLQSITIGNIAGFRWRNTPSAITGATVPTSLFAFTAGAGSSIFFEGVDLSAMGSGKTLFVASGSAADHQTIFKDCKLGASVTVYSGSPSGTGTLDFLLIRCDSGDTNYRTERYAYSGTQTTETTIVRSGGATDGTTPIAWKIVTTANSEWEFPFESLPISIWNETVGSAITVTIQGIWGGGAAPNNDEIWIDVEYLGTSGFPLASKATSSKADGLATGTAIPAGSGAWGGSTTKFAMACTFAPQEKGPLTIYVRAAKVSSTFYIDPKPVVT
jgi:hypothetical protein